MKFVLHPVVRQLTDGQAVVGAHGESADSNALEQLAQASDPHVDGRTSQLDGR